jgi:hypothetical protein
VNVIAGNNEERRQTSLQVHVYPSEVSFNAKLINYIVPENLL